MKKRSKILALSLVALLTMGIFAGCGNDEAANTGSASSSTSESSAAPESGKTDKTDKDDAQKEDAQNTTVDTSSNVHAVNADIIGEVTVTDGGTLTVDVYEPHTSDVSLLTIKGSDLSATGASEIIELDDIVNIKQVLDGDLVASSADIIKKGDVVAVITTEDGSKELLILALGK